MSAFTGHVSARSPRPHAHFGVLSCGAVQARTFLSPKNAGHNRVVTVADPGDGAGHPAPGRGAGPEDSAAGGSAWCRGAGGGRGLVSSGLGPRVRAAFRQPPTMEDACFSAVCGCFLLGLGRFLGERQSHEHGQAACTSRSLRRDRQRPRTRELRRLRARVAKPGVGCGACVGAGGALRAAAPRVAGAAGGVHESFW